MTARNTARPNTPTEQNKEDNTLILVMTNSDKGSACTSQR